MRPVLVDAHQVGLCETGNETVARNLVAALERDGREPPHYVLSRGDALTDVPDARRHVVSGSSSRRLLWDLPAVVRSVRPEVLVVQYTLPLVRVPAVVLVHDLSYLDPRARDWIPPAALLRYRATIGASVRRARVVLAPSEFTRARLLEAYGLDADRVLLAPLALDPALARELSSAPTARRRPDHDTVLCVGTVLPRKNLLVVARAVGRMRSEGRDVRLRLVGPQRAAGSTQLAAARALLGTALEAVGPVSLEVLAQEYHAASALAFPSLYEGFGLPLLEGMAAGVPVVSSNATCLPEVAGDAAVLLDPYDDAAWATALGNLLDDPGRSARMRAAGRERAATFSWSTTADAVRRAVDLASSPA